MGRWVAIVLLIWGDKENMLKVFHRTWRIPQKYSSVYGEYKGFWGCFFYISECAKTILSYIESTCEEKKRTWKMYEEFFPYMGSTPIEINVSPPR